MWARSITHDAANGFRLPLQEYWNVQRDVRDGLCVIPPSARESFSFVGEHVSDDVAVTVIERLLDAARWHRQDGFVTAPWDARIAWLEGALGDVWTARGAWPGLAAVLTYLECDSGPSLARELLQKSPSAGWPEV